MFDRRMFAQMKRAGMGVRLSKAKLSQAMLEILIQLPVGTKDIKETIVGHLGLLGQMSATRDINAAWNETKKKATREYPEKFLLGHRGVLHWNDGSLKVLDNGRLETFELQLVANRHAERRLVLNHENAFFHDLTSGKVS